MRRTRSLTLALIAIIGVALIATGYGVAQLTSVETEVRVVARPHEDGRVEFAVQQRVDGEWGERIAPSARYLTPALIESRAGRWLNSSPITLTVAFGRGTSEPTEPQQQPNRAPIADAGPDASYDLSTIAVQLNGLGSRDPDGDSLIYEWTQTTGPTILLRNPGSAAAWFESPRAAQTLTFQLSVADEDGASATDTVVLEFVNVPPTAEAGADQEVTRGQEVTLYGSGSDDAPEGNLIYSWSQVSGPAVELSDITSSTPTFTAPNEYDQIVFSLTVSDGQLESSPNVVIVTVRNTPPIADAGTDQEVSRGKRVTLDGRASTDPDGDPLTYQWTQTSGDAVRLINPDAARPSFTAPETGQTLIFQLEVSDGYDSAVSTAHISVVYEPVVASNFNAASARTALRYQAQEDVFSGNVRTDVRMQGSNDDLMLDVVCFDNGSAAVGFWLLDLEQDSSFADELEVTWRLDDGEVMRRTLEVDYLGTTPTLYFQNTFGGFESTWPQVLDGGKLAVRIGYRGVHEEVFDLDAFARTPVHLNLVNCDSY